MKIYLAGRYGRKNEMVDYAKNLKAAGHHVTSRWIYGEHDGVSEAVCASHDLEDIDAAEVLISFGEKPREMNNSRGGRHVEFGYALAKEMRIILVGYREGVFTFLPQVEFCGTFENAMEVLGAGK